jgi:hypothetical protein
MRNLKKLQGVAMKRHRAGIALIAVISVSTVATDAQTEGWRTMSVTIRPATLAGQIEEFAGHSVRVPYARVVGVFNPQALVVDTATTLPPTLGNRERVLVLVEERALNVPAALIVGSTVTISGVARTLLGVQVTREVPWPVELSPDVVKRLEIRAALLARSVQTADGIELTTAATVER